MYHSDDQQADQENYDYDPYDSDNQNYEYQGQIDEPEYAEDQDQQEPRQNVLNLIQSLYELNLQHHHQKKVHKKIDNNIAPSYGKEIRIERINYGIFDREDYYLIDEGGKNYEFCNGGIMRFKKHAEKLTTLELTDQKFYRISINVSQIQSIYNFPELQMISICTNFPPQYSFNYQDPFKCDSSSQQPLLSLYENFIQTKFIVKSDRLPFWKRISNIQLSKFQQKYPNQILLSHILTKYGTIFIRLFQYSSSIQNLKEQLFGHQEIIEIELQKQILDFTIKKSYEGLAQRYSMKNFEKCLDFHPKDQSQRIYKFQIMYSLISLLNISKYNVGIKDVFELAFSVTDLINKFGMKLHSIWKAIKNLTPIHLEVLSNQDRAQRLMQLLLILTSSIEQKQKKIKIEQEIILSNSITVPLFKITPSGLLPSGWSTDLRNRLVRHYNHMDHQFIKVQVVDDNGENSSLCMFDDIFRADIQRRLTKINFLNRTYIPLGWTQSQLKKASIWFTLQSADCSFIPRNQLLDFLGDFSNIMNPALKMARIGQNLSTGFSVKISENVKVEYQKDDYHPKNPDRLFTDGIGMISEDLINQIQQETGKKSTVFQVRFRGSKGLLALNQQLQYGTIVLRKSMKKFECPSKAALCYLDILQGSYYKVGYLNRQIILLLQANGIHPHEIMDLQRQYIREIINLDEKLGDEGEKSIEKQIMNKILNNEIDQYEDFQIENIAEILGKMKRQKKMKVLDEPILGQILCEQYKVMLQVLVKKSRIKVEKSARILGIIDEFSVLKQDEVYCTISYTDKSGNQIVKNISGRVMLTRNPCMHPADIRVVNCVSQKEVIQRFQNYYGINNMFEKLKNCVIFPKDGQIPLTAQISGSDLDGDEFFITWDERIIPKESKKPYIADELIKVQRNWGGSGYKQILTFFTQFICNDELGKIGNSHLAKADRTNPQSHDCLQLCKAYNMAVDYPKKGYKFSFNKKFKPQEYPHFMQKYDKKQYQSKTSIGRVYNAAKRQFKEFVDKILLNKKKAHFLPRFPTLSFSTYQIRQGLESILEFNQMISKMIIAHNFERESQIYAMPNIKANKNQLMFLSKQKQIFFSLFFRNLPLKHHMSPQKYYELVRQAFVLAEYNYKLQPKVEQKLLLWYHIIHYNNFSQASKPIQNNINQWKAKLNNIAIENHLNLSKLKYIGLLWFCMPSLTFLAYRNNNMYEYEKQ